jgi:hypothetical protein
MKITIEPDISEVQKWIAIFKQGGTCAYSIATTEVFGIDISYISEKYKYAAFNEDNDVVLFVNGDVTRRVYTWRNTTTGGFCIGKTTTKAMHWEDSLTEINREINS